jgi:hypothetical protein
MQTISSAELVINREGLEPLFTRERCQSPTHRVIFNSHLTRAAGITAGIALLAVACAPGPPSRGASDASRGGPSDARAVSPERGRARLETVASIAATPGERGFDLAVAIAQDQAGDLYVLEYPSSRVRVLSGDGDSLRALARHTTGMREVGDALALAFLPDSTLGLFTPAPSQIVKLDRFGNIVGRARIAALAAAQGATVVIRKALCRGDNLVLGGTEARPADQKQARTHFVRRYGATGEILATYAAHETIIDMTSRHITEAEAFAPLATSFTVGRDGRVYVAPQRDAYRIEVYTLEGALERVIERAFTPAARTHADSARVRCLYDGWARETPIEISYELEPTEPAILALEIDARGRLWVRHSRGALDPQTAGSVAYDIFDREGCLVEVIDVACDETDGLHFLGGDRVMLVRNEAGAEFVRAGGRLGWLTQAEIAGAAASSFERAIIGRVRE